MTNELKSTSRTRGNLKILQYLPTCLGNEVYRTYHRPMPVCKDRQQTDTYDYSLESANTLYTNTNPTNIKTGNTLSPNLFKLTLETIFKQLNCENKYILAKENIE